MLICLQKINFIPPSFLRYCENITSLLFWVLWVYLAMNSKNDTVSLYMTLLFIFMQKTIFIKNSKNFRFAYFLGKSNYFFKKKKKKEKKKKKRKKERKKEKYSFLDPFYSNLGKMEFYTKIKLRHFLASIYSPLTL